MRLRRRAFFRWLRVLRWLGYRQRADALALAHALEHGRVVVLDLQASAGNLTRALEEAEMRARSLHDFLAEVTAGG